MEYKLNIIKVQRKNERKEENDKKNHRNYMRHGSRKETNAKQMREYKKLYV